ncbi:hypothetical protein [Clostridium botulinum]|uniref:hypothetical protein n=1 Tax=Clostridium botulinum TaxID=1491 RepID=UPI00057C5799|nr:hypothetical protein [Clostridium botulinum]QPW61974.1 hypothetical protein IG390_14050 [Clostridium botulinum]
MGIYSKAIWLLCILLIPLDLIIYKFLPNDIEVKKEAYAPETTNKFSTPILLDNKGSTSISFIFIIGLPMMLLYILKTLKFYNIYIIILSIFLILILIFPINELCDWLERKKNPILKSRELHLLILVYLFLIILTIGVHIGIPKYNTIEYAIFMMIIFIAYILICKVLYSLLIYRYNILKDKSIPILNQFFSLFIIGMLIIIAFISIGYYTNYTLFVVNNDFFHCNLQKENITSWQLIYYTISTFLTFCAENIIANHWTSQLACLLSKITTIFSVTILLSVLIGLLPDNIDSVDNKNTNE